MRQKNKKQLADCFIDEALSLWSKHLSSPHQSDTAAFKKYCLGKKKTATPFYLFYACQVVAIHCTIREVDTFSQSHKHSYPLINRLRTCLYFFNSRQIRAGFGQLYLYQTSIQAEFDQALKANPNNKTHIATLLQIVVTLQFFTQEHISGNRFVEPNQKFFRFLQQQERDLAKLITPKQITTTPHTPPCSRQKLTAHADWSPGSSPGTTNPSVSDGDLSWAESYNPEEKSDDTSSLDGSISDGNSDTSSSITITEYSLFGDGPWADLHAKLRKQLASLSSRLS